VAQVVEGRLKICLSQPDYTSHFVAYITGCWAPELGRRGVLAASCVATWTTSCWYDASRLSGEYGTSAFADTPSAYAGATAWSSAFSVGSNAFSI
jgi:hypothetical protein